VVARCACSRISNPAWPPPRGRTAAAVWVACFTAAPAQRQGRRERLVLLAVEPADFQEALVRELFHLSARLLELGLGLARDGDVRDKPVLRVPRDQLTFLAQHFVVFRLVAGGW